MVVVVVVIVVVVLSVVFLNDCFYIWVYRFAYLVLTQISLVMTSSTCHSGSKMGA